MESEKEARLARIVQKLEAKIKTVWDRNRELEQKLELEGLDKDLAEEHARAAEARAADLEEEIQHMQLRLDELGELAGLNAELEESYAAEKADLLAEIARFQHTQNEMQAEIISLRAANEAVQQTEGLHQELEFAKLRLKAAELDLAVATQGLEQALRPLLAPEHRNLLPFIAFLHLDVKESYSQMKVGDISAAKFGELLEGQVNAALFELAQPEWPALVVLVRNVQPSPQLSKLLNTAVNGVADDALASLTRELLASHSEENIDRLDAYVSRMTQTESNEATSATEHTGNPAQDTENAAQCASREEALQLRITYLESKLELAQSVGDELAALKASQAAAHARETSLMQRIVDTEMLLSTRDREIAKLKQAELPATLDAALAAQRFKALESALKWYSYSPAQKLQLDPLRVKPAAPVSVLTGNRRVASLRRLAPTIRLAEAGDGDARWLSIQQETALMLL